MRAVIQRVRGASVAVNGETVGAVDDRAAGLLVFLGVGRGDDEAEAEWLSDRIVKLRIFDDERGQMNRTIRESGGGVLVISQFTLFGSLKKGNRPSYHRAAAPAEAVPLYEYFVGRMEALLGKPVGTGRFGAEMRIDACQDGPVTLIVDSRERDF